MAYSYQQLMSLWVQVGGSRATAPLAAAVAMAESGGNPNAYNKNNNGSVDRGLWQINSIHGSLSTMDPQANALAAVKISSNGTNWTPWVAFTTGRYRQFLKADASPRSSTSGPSTAGTRGKQRGGSNDGWSPADPVKDAADAAMSIGDFIGALGKAETWLRVGEGIIGAIALVGGVVILFSVIADKTGATAAVGQVVGIVGPGGKVAKAASVVSSVKGK